MTLLKVLPDTEFVIVEVNFRLRPVDLAMPEERRNVLLMANICEAVVFHENHGLKILQTKPTHCKYQDNVVCCNDMKRLLPGATIPFQYYESGTQENDDDIGESDTALSPKEQIALSGKLHMFVTLHAWERQILVTPAGDIERMKSLGYSQGFTPVTDLEDDLRVHLKGRKYDADLYR